MHAQPLATLNALDWGIVGGYFALVFAILLRTRRTRENAGDFLLAGARLPGWLVAASLLATSFSAISLLSLPSEGYRNGFGVLQLWLGELVAAVLVVILFVPVYRAMGVTTAHELLERRLGRRARLVASALFHGLILMRTGLLLLLTSRAVEALSGMPLDVSILVVGATALLYSALGGLRAVVWTDALQLGAIVVGLGTVVVLLAGGLEQPGAAFLAAAGGTNGRPPAIDLSLSFSRSPSLFAGGIAYAIPLLFVAGTNQQAVQRYMACRSLRDARGAILGAWALGTCVAALSVGVGVLLFAHKGAGFARPDRELIHFVLSDAPRGLAGLIAAAVFAASMSSVDSAVHALATATLVDGVDAHRRRPLADDVRLRLARLFVLGHGALATGLALILVHAAQGESIFSKVVAWLGLFGGPGCALYLLALLPRRRPSEGAVLVGVAAGFVAALAVSEHLPWAPAGGWLPAWGLHPIWISAFGFLASVAGTCVAIGVRSTWQSGRGEGPPS